MNVGWFFLIGAALVMMLVLLFPGRRRPVSMNQQTPLERLDELDARLKQRDEVLRLIQARQKINAIKLYRSETGASLLEAKNAVERMAYGMRMGALTREEVEERDVSGTLSDEVLRLIAARQKISAIKQYRQETGVSLKEAKEVVERAEALARFSGVRELDTPMRERAVGLETPSEEVLRLFRAGQKINAIKQYRQETGTSLKEAKEVVDGVEDNMRSGFD